MDEAKQPGINFNTIFLKEIQFKREPAINSNQINIDFESNVSLSEDKKQLIYELGCNVSDKNNVFKLHCSMIGVFSSMEGSENMELEKFAENNAPAIMMPYIRELVTTTTVRAGLNPITFPPINILSAFHDKKQQLTK